MVNKIDGEEVEPDLLPAFYELGVEQLWPISAEHGYGIRTFMDDLVTALPEHEASSLQPADSIRIAFFGRPNVGKSSLINRLLGQERMVVSDIPGTTRDAVEEALDIQGLLFRIIDTAGIRKTHSKIEKESVKRTKRYLSDADVILTVFDNGEEMSKDDEQVIEDLRLNVNNKKPNGIPFI